MFDVGFAEIMLIMVIALIVVGPERLPKLARTIGLWVGKARRIVGSVKSEVERELRVEELKQSIKEQSALEEFNQLKQDVKAFGNDVKSMGSDLKSATADINQSASGRSGDAVSEPSASEPSAPAAPPPATPSVSSAPSNQSAETRKDTSLSGSDSRR